MNNPIISITNLSASYITAGEPVQAVQNISFDIQQGAVSYTHLTLPTKA